MKELELRVDGRTVDLVPPACLANGQLLVPVRSFSQAVGARVEELDGGGLAVCQGELCVPLTGAEMVEVEGEMCTRLDDLGEALGLDWQVTGEILRVSGAGREPRGLEIGQPAPDFELADLHTGELVSADDFRGKKAIFYMWASW